VEDRQDRRGRPCPPALRTRPDHLITQRHTSLRGKAQWHYATRDHAEQLVAIYSHIAASYAVHAIEAFTLLANGDQPDSWRPHTIVPSDILAMHDVLIPLVQLPDHAVNEDDRPHIGRYNDDLRQAHNDLARAITNLAQQEPVAIFDQPDRLAQREQANDLDDQLPHALHDYAAAAICALELLARSRRDAAR
jgi:hypothetical protein